ncbi:MAG TPA: hypothetical protein VJN43_05710 [Bryobacteraceae bacterium]|nr:hypothetical protein [Bryobacteraceae bacterium]
MQRQTLVRVLVQIYRLLLYAYPRDFRRSYAREMMLAFHDRCREIAETRGDFALTRFSLRTFFDWLSTVAGERLASTAEDVAFAGIPAHAADGVPSFYTSANYSPRRGALIHGGMLSIAIFIGLYLTMSHWTAHLTGPPPALTGTYRSRRLPVLGQPLVSERDLETLVKPDRTKARDAWSAMLALVKKPSAPPESQPPQHDVSRPDNTASKKDPGLRTALSWLAGALAVRPSLPAFAQQKPNFSGKWTLNKPASDFGNFSAPDAQIDIIEHNEPNIRLMQTIRGDAVPGGEATSERRYTTDGKENINKIGDRELKSRTVWDESKLVITTNLPSPGGPIEIKDTWVLTASGQMVITRHFRGPQDERRQKLIFIRGK